jgi:hypothetical protein
MLRDELIDDIERAMIIKTHDHQAARQLRGLNSGGSGCRL